MSINAEIATSSANRKVGKENLISLAALFPYLRPYRLRAFFALLSLLSTTIVVLCLGKIVKYLVDLGFVLNSHHNLNLILLCSLLAIVVLAVTGYFRSSLVNSIGEQVIADLRHDVYSHIIRVSPAFFEITRTGDVISRLTVDTTLLYNVITNSISFALRNLLLFAGGIVFLFLTDLKLTLVALAAIPVAIAPIILMGKKIKELSVKSQGAMAGVSSHIEETVNAVKIVQAYLGEEREIVNFNKYVTRALNISLDKIKLRSLLIALVIVFAFSSVTAVLWFGSYRVLAGYITSGELSSFIFYCIITATSLVSISQIVGQLQVAAGATERLFELLNAKSPIAEITNPLTLSVLEGVTIKFQEVDFYYPSRPELTALKNFNLEIKPGERVALVGHSGSGKSTILQLILRFYDVLAGEILINGCDVRNLALRDLRSCFSYISQDCLIFSGTILDNIIYNEQDKISEAEINKIIAGNEAFSFINKLPKKLYNQVGEKGVKLSGGERQRIALLRALVKDSPVLLLDEATSALDNENEQAVSILLKQLMDQKSAKTKKTIIAIAHKLSRLTNFDRIIFIRDGKIAESGTHKELMAQNGLYKKMYEAENLYDF